jgi:hypothetical protein
MKDLWPEAPQRPADRDRRPRPRGDGRDRPLVSDGYGPGDDPHRWVVGGRPARGQDHDIVPPGAEVPAQVPDVNLNATRCIPRVGTGQGDPHEGAALPIPPAVSPDSSQAGWNMCQSAGDEAM